MKINLPASVTSKVAMKTLVLKKHSPQIMFFGGMALMGATVVSACRATLQLEDTLEEIRRDREDLKANAFTHPEKFPENKVDKLNNYITMRGVAKITRLYLPALSLGVAAVACLTGAHNTLNRRNAGLSAALATTERALARYRERVVDTYGEDADRDLMYGTETVKRKVVKEDGTGKTEKIKVHGEGRSPYARIWGRDTSTEWDPIPEYNLAKLRSVQSLMNMQLESRGHVFLNDVFDELGLSRTTAGAVVGWLSEKHGGRDGYIDLGVLSQGEEVAFVDFMTGHEDHLLLDFNVDGEIFRRI